MTSALTRLRELPEAFTFAGFCKLSRFSNNAASVCLRRWKEKGLIEPAGERAKIYFNKLRSPEIDGALRVAALSFEYPSGILCGESVLHASGWITQIPAQLSVAVLSRPSYVSLHGFDIRGRPLSWFRKIHPLTQSSVEERVYGLRALSPALALADLYAQNDGWHPDPDDLDIPEQDHELVLSAFELLGLDRNVAQTVVTGKVE
jgi:hypothetical protein